MLRLSLVLALYLFGVAVSAQAFSSSAAPAAKEQSPADANAELDAEIAALLASPWERSMSIRSGLGYRDNVLLSPFAPIARLFAQAEIEGFAWRLPMQKWEVVTFLNGDVLRYFSPPRETSGEQQWFGHGEVRWLPVEVARVGISADVYYNDMVMDLSETEATRQILATRSQGALLTAAGRVDLPAAFTLAPSVQMQRSTFRNYPGDYDDLKSGARLEWKHGKALVVSAGWFERARRYDERPQFTAGGRALTGTHLHFHQHEGELKVVDALTWHGRWSGTAAIGRLENRDGASGYFDYREKRARLEISWERAPWKFTVGGDARRRDYLVQTAGIGVSPPRRLADEFEVNGRIERAIGKVWSIYAVERWERSRSNQIDFNYRSNTSIVGVQRVY